MEQYRRVCVQRSGYAVVKADTDAEAVQAASKLSENDFDWEPVTPDMILDEIEIIETCGPDGEAIK